MTKMRMHTGAWLLLLAAIYLIGDWAGATAFSSLMWRSNLPFPKMYEGQYDAEIVCLGNSRGVHGFPKEIMEEITGKRVANLSFNGLAPQIAECFLRDYLDHCPPPKVVLAEANFIEMATTAPGVMKFSPYFSKSPRLFDLASSFDWTYPVVGRISKLMQYNSDLTTYAAIHFLAHRGKEDEDALVRRQISPQVVADTKVMSPLSLQINEEEAAAVKRMAEECRQRGIEFKLVLTGYLPAYREKIENLEDWKADVAKATGVEVIDLSDVPSDAAFFDRVHLNAEGSRLTAEMIVEQGLLD
jgi:hypothetical protein